MEYNNNTNCTLNLIIDKKLNTLEISVLQDAMLLSGSVNQFILNRNHLRFKSKNNVTRQSIDLAVKGLESKNILIQIGKHQTFIVHKLNFELINKEFFYV
jgi:hypothetical protein